MSARWTIDRMTMRPSPASDGVVPAASGSLPRLLRIDRTFGVIDGCLALVAVSMGFTTHLVFLQLTFLLLMLGGCYWRFQGFVARTLLWVGIALVQMLVAVSSGDAAASDLLAVPLLTVMLVIVHLLATRRHRVERTLTHAELHDQLTRLPNRTAFLRRLEETLAATSTERRAVAVISLDIDGFKAVNDDYGHAAADRLLVVLAERLRRCVRADDTVARVGGDEFLIVVRSDPGTVPRIAQRLSEAVESPFLIDGIEICVTASLGVALSEEPSARVRDELVRHAEAAMRRVKSEGRAGYEVFSPMTAAA
jgi:diguanylate cyclase (GGDEF)-like protein